jgi:uncharacterized DUF497 family protein
MTFEDPGPEVEQLNWDDWNREHIARHGVTIDEVEAVIRGETLVQATYKQRFLVLGATQAGRMLAVVIGPVPGQHGAFYTFTARPASRAERRLYQHAREYEEP